MPEPDAPLPTPAGTRHPVRIGAAFWVQRTDWPSLREAVVAAEDAGADDLWVDDHLLSDEGDATTRSSRAGRPWRRSQP